MIARKFLKPFAAFLLGTASASSPAHEGEDHNAGDARTVKMAPAPSGRLTAQSESLELVAAAAGHGLTMWIDQWADNAPVTNARVSVSVDGRSIEARPVDGTYIIDTARLDAPGAHRLSFAVTRGETVQTMAGTMNVAAARAAAEPGGLPWRTILPVLLALAAAVGALLLWRARRHGPAVALVLAAMLVQPNPIFAHEGEDHGENEAAAPATPAGPGATGGDAAGTGAMRTADGAIVALKPLQRIIGLRTEVARAGEASPTISLTGRIIADPQGGGLVQSTTGGRIVAAGGLPLIG